MVGLVIVAMSLGGVWCVIGLTRSMHKGGIRWADLWSRQSSSSGGNEHQRCQPQRLVTVEDTAYTASVTQPGHSPANAPAWYLNLSGRLGRQGEDRGWFLKVTDGWPNGFAGDILFSLVLIAMVGIVLGLHALITLFG